MKITDFWNVPTRSLAGRCQSFGETCCLYLQSCININISRTLIQQTQSVVTWGHTGATTTPSAIACTQCLRRNASRSETVTSASEKRWSRHRIDPYSCIILFPCVLLQHNISSKRRPCSSKNRASALASYRCVLVTISPDKGNTHELWGTCSAVNGTPCII